MPWNLPGGSSYTLTLPFRRKKRTYVINEPDPVYPVIYLGNVLTLMAKGDGCADKSLALIWKTYCSRTRPDLSMRLMVTRSGLKAETKQQGLTEYWSHRITYCFAPPQYPKVFCWIYKHEGKRMKPELRCHAVLCRRASEPPAIALKLQELILAALEEYKRDKLSSQKRRLGLDGAARVAGSLTAGGDPGLLSGLVTMPRRRRMLDKRSTNYRPPLSRSKSAPKLDNIDEDLEEEEEEEVTASSSEAPPTDDRSSVADSDTVVCLEPHVTLTVRASFDDEEEEEDLPSTPSSSSTPPCFFASPSGGGATLIAVGFDDDELQSSPAAAGPHRRYRSSCSYDDSAVLEQRRRHTAGTVEVDDVSETIADTLRLTPPPSAADRRRRQMALSKRSSDVGYASLQGGGGAGSEEEEDEEHHASASVASSDESGYHERSEKSSLEEDGGDDEEDGRGTLRLGSEGVTSGGTAAKTTVTPLSSCIQITSL